jgi:hypothetical protein
MKANEAEGLLDVLVKLAERVAGSLDRREVGESDFDWLQRLVARPSGESAAVRLRALREASEAVCDHCAKGRPLTQRTEKNGGSFYHPSWGECAAGPIQIILGRAPASAPGGPPKGGNA